MNYIIVASLLLAVCVTCSSALMCFQCNSQNDTSCSDDFQTTSSAVRTTYLLDCPVQDGIEPYCRKAKFWIDAKGRDSRITVYRGCGYKERKDRPCYVMRAEDHTSETCQCRDAECNGSPRLYQISGIAMATFVVVLAKLF